MQPGAISSWSYNNYAFGVLGQTIELASGMCMNDLLRRDLFDVVGIDGAFAAGDLEDSSQLVTLVYHGGGVARLRLHPAQPARPRHPRRLGKLFLRRPQYQRCGPGEDRRAAGQRREL